MVEGYNQNISSTEFTSTPDSKSSELVSWIRSLQQALTVEVDRGFINIQGRTNKFSYFVSGYLLSCPSTAVNQSHLSKLKELASDYERYSTMSTDDRRRIVVQTRQTLHNLYKEQEGAKHIEVNKIKIKTSHDSSAYRRGSSINSLSLGSSISAIKGVGAKQAERLSSLGLILIRDLINYFPRDYVDYTSLKTINKSQVGQNVTIVAKVRRCSSFKSPKNPNLSILELFIKDKTGGMKVTKFFAGRRNSSIAYVKSQQNLYAVGATVAVSGLVKESRYGKSLNDPLIEIIDSHNGYLKSKLIGQIFPVYSLTEGITADKFRDLVQSILFLTSEIKEPLPKDTLKRLDLPTKKEAFFYIHNPENSRTLAKAKRRIVFEEFLLLQVSLLLRRELHKKCNSPQLSIELSSNSLVKKFLSILPFSLTDAQKRVLKEIEADIVKSEPMSRLLQGDVGSGKTVIAISALLTAVQSGWQAAFMAPTEVLASQHYQTLSKWIPELGINTDLLTGSTPKSRRKEILTDLVNGSTKILVGTHALFEDPVVFDRLGLVVVDEQHRFGVKQRNKLLNKGLQPHLLTMTATPIPRTLALTLHGDLDVSQLDELPPGRTPINTQLISPKEKEFAYDLIRSEINKGHQIYVVLPLIEESEKLELSSAVDVHHQLSTDVFSDFTVELLHGKMKSVEKQEVIRNFLNKKSDILVSTTVIEVGVDVPNASVMLIEDSDRFGLAQLHQLRGRVGRGASKSYCLLSHQNKNKSSRQRLEVLVNSNDGFEISEIDLRFRGPGQVLGTKQSGLPDFALASLANDADVLELARNEARNILDSDPSLTNNFMLRSLIKEQWEKLKIGNKLN
ncbi:ATP-dependent DNA helicase RecG [Prochlorococcus marinus]|uniref:ATP-dependent DNA helicase RecG n=1 Tax=Prochlorococcus marinus TaxID=1219 RepID=UPI0022B40D78|nr:ATP-dependent DNA helicase RecG [Prochlorococcus marinus]